jgi:hypothetical protein
MNLSIIYTFRNRNVSRLGKSLQSIFSNFNRITLDIIVVDYGSDDSHKDELRKLADLYHIRIIRTETQGLPWSRGKAMNIGVLNAAYENVLTTDMDMFFEADFSEYIKEDAKENEKVHCQPYWLPKSGKIEKAILGNKNQLGGFMFINKQTFLKVGGFSEKIEFWGAEDAEFNHRAHALGVKTKWLPTEFRMFHMWHPLSYGVFDPRPMNSIVNDQRILLQAISIRSTDYSDVRSPSIGRILSLEDRPILPYLTQQNFDTLEINPNGLRDILPLVFRKLHSSRLICLDVGGQFLKLSLFGNIYLELKEPTVSFFFRKVNAVLNRFGFRIQGITNLNFDYFYSLIEVWKEDIVDYYVDVSENKLYILTKAIAEHPEGTVYDTFEN